MYGDFFRIGLDVGSTTAKIVVLNNEGEIHYSCYSRHNANVLVTVADLLNKVKEAIGDIPVSISVTGSVGMGISELLSVPYVQEVIAAIKYSRKKCLNISTIIDIGGEDAKIVYFRNNGNVDLRMNSNCAGGTGAFIDQMAILLGVDLTELNSLASRSCHIHPIASRCGVFSKTDVQNLISINIDKADIAASVFHAVTMQTIVSLSHGYKIEPRILLCGGPLTFLASLRKSFLDCLNLDEDSFIIPPYGNLIPAIGTALSVENCNKVDLSYLIGMLNKRDNHTIGNHSGITKIFSSSTEYVKWKKSKQKDDIETARLEDCHNGLFIGIDSGSTTTKIVAIDEKERLLYSFYSQNNGNPIETARKGLEEFRDACDNAGVTPFIKGSCSTGYGESLIKAAFGLNTNIIETIAHCKATKKIKPDVSLILDIGGQDMKAIFIEKGIISRIEINEACSSGCGSFIETFSKSLDQPLEEFANQACFADNPCDLGTRCTVFMNSKVKQVLREGASIGDIAAGLSYSLVKNCLFKVLKFTDPSDLGDVIAVQGGTMKNDSVVRGLEKIIGKEVYRCEMPELMGAYGSAIHAKMKGGKQTTINDILRTIYFSTRKLRCHGCENNCYINCYQFGNGTKHFSGNKCEKVFSNQNGYQIKGINCHLQKYDLLFNRESNSSDGIVIGIPRCLNMYEDYPFWHSLFKNAKIPFVLSDPSTFSSYEAGLHTVMSDNICFPAKLAHSHIINLADKGVGRIFFPFVVHEERENDNSVNSYNCPIVTAYSEVMKSAIETRIPIDSPVISFNDHNVLKKQCVMYLKGLGVKHIVALKAVIIALEARTSYENNLRDINKAAIEAGDGKLTILLAGRPYHVDPLIQHKISDMIAGMGINVITEDIVSKDVSLNETDTHMITQWSYINRILKAAQWVSGQNRNIQFVQMTSFGCGPDAFLIDEVRSILRRGGKVLTILKIDDVNNLGSTRLRVRSLIESLKFNNREEVALEQFITTPVFTRKNKEKLIIAPYFTDYISPLMPSVFKLAGYNIEILPESDSLSAEEGLKYANNEVCYPATLIVGDIVKALKSGKYSLSDTTVAISQTGGQCRATNYISLIKNGLINSGFKDIPVVAVAMGSGLINEQPGFRINWFRMLPIIMASVIFGDCISKFYHASVVRENNKGDAMNLRTKYLEMANNLILSDQVNGIYNLIGIAAKDFNSILDNRDSLPKVGVVGEIFLKFNSFAHYHVVKWFINRGIEVVPPLLLDFFLQFFVNRKVNNNAFRKKEPLADLLFNTVYSLIRKQIGKVNELASSFELFDPFPDIFKESEYAKEVISLSAQFGEGWLLPGEIVAFSHKGINNVLSLQPFGCIANHIISKGVEKKIKTLYPQINILSLDFDSGISSINLINRLILFADNIMANEEKRTFSQIGEPEPIDLL